MRLAPFAPEIFLFNDQFTILLEAVRLMWKDKKNCTVMPDRPVTAGKFMQIIPADEEGYGLGGRMAGQGLGWWPWSAGITRYSGSFA